MRSSFIPQQTDESASVGVPQMTRHDVALDVSSSAISINSVATGSFRGIEALASKRGVHSLRNPRTNRIQSPRKVGPRYLQVSLSASAMSHIASRHRSQWSRIASYERYRAEIWSGLARRTIAQTLSHPDAKAPRVGNNTWKYTKKFTLSKTKFDQLGTTHTPVATTVVTVIWGSPVNNIVTSYPSIPKSIPGG